MANQAEKDSKTGLETTGHEWDGIKELNTPLPKWWVYVFYATILFSIVYYVLYPAIPGISGYTKGLLGYSSRQELSRSLAEAAAQRSAFLGRIEKASLSDIRSNDELLNFALAGGKAAFADNCAPCHGTGATGGPGYPNLADDDWLWGGKLEDIFTTLRHGVRWTQDEDTRGSEMPRFGDGILEPAEINDVAEFVLSLSGRGGDPAAARRGAAVFAEQCAACHGARGEGGREVGAPRLSDTIWLYGEDKATIVRQIRTPRHGVMPAWGERLDEATLKMLAVYVHSLGGGE